MKMTAALSSRAKRQILFCFVGVKSDSGAVILSEAKDLKLPRYSEELGEKSEE